MRLLVLGHQSVHHHTDADAVMIRKCMVTNVNITSAHILSLVPRHRGPRAFLRASQSAEVDARTGKHLDAGG